MLPLLFSAKDRAGSHKGANYAGDKSRMHYKILRENNYRRGYEAQTATQFLQSKTQYTHCRVVAAAIAFNRTRSDSMKTTLLLTDEGETLNARTATPAKKLAEKTSSGRHVESSISLRDGRF